MRAGGCVKLYFPLNFAVNLKLLPKNHYVSSDVTYTLLQSRRLNAVLWGCEDAFLVATAWPRMNRHCATEAPLNRPARFLCPVHAAPLPASPCLRAPPGLGSEILKLPVGVSYPASRLATAFRVCTLLSTSPLNIKTYIICV